MSSSNYDGCTSLASSSNSNSSSCRSAAGVTVDLTVVIANAVH